MDSQGRKSKIVEPYYLRLYDAADAELKTATHLLRGGLVMIQAMLDRGRQLEEIWSKYGNDIDLLIHTIESEKKSND
jgi:hypothetical protein